MIHARLPAALAALLLAACSSSGPVREPAELVDIESPRLTPSVRWDASPGAGSEDIHTGLRLAVEPDAIFTADVDGRVFALDPESGRELWSAETGARVVSGPTVAGDRVLVGTLDAEVIALKRADGKPLWRVPVSSEVLAAPVSEGGLVIVRCVDGKVFGLAEDSGARRWSFDRAVPPLTLRGLSVPLVSGGIAFIGMDNGRVAALRLEDGQVAWEQVVAAASGRSELERIVDVDGDLLVTKDGVYAVSFGGELAAVSLEDGRVAWRRPVKSFTGIALQDKLLAVSDEDGVVWALDAETGAAAWKQEALKYRRLSAPVAVGGYFVVADFEGYLHWLSPADGRIVARVRAVDDPVTTAPIELDGLLYVLADDGEVAAVSFN